MTIKLTYKDISLCFKCLDLFQLENHAIEIKQ